jgi:prepilin-type N-terminal cleavage/methylation domain-containing protein
MYHNLKQKGFTLIEIMVVVFIITTMAGLSFFALNQASDRRYSSQAEDFLVWLEQLSDLAMLEGSAYGLTASDQGIQAVVFYNYDWYEVSMPEPFYFDGDVRLSLLESNEGEERIINQNNARSDNRSNQSHTLLPDIIMLPNGYIEPDTNLSLVFENYSPIFIYRQEENGINLAIERSL